MVNICYCNLCKNTAHKKKGDRRLSNIFFLHKAEDQRICNCEADCNVNCVVVDISHADFLNKYCENKNSKTGTDDTFGIYALDMHNHLI